MKLPVLAVLGAALLLSACAKKEAEACASPDVKDQLMRIFLQGAITERSPEFKDSALRDVAILEKDPDSGVLSCVGTLSVPAGQQVVEGVLQYRIAPVAKSDYDYLLLDTAGANTTAGSDGCSNGVSYQRLTDRPMAMSARLKVSPAT